jgi:3-oxoacyl-[acyl-carrier protein] reductase
MGQTARQPATRTVVVTGGGTGIGRAAAERFAAAGERVVLVGRRVEVLERAAAELGAADRGAPEARWRGADLTRAEDVAETVAWIVAEVSPTIDVLVNNAGGNAGDPEPGAAIEDAQRAYDHIMDSNVRSSFLMTWAVAPHLRRPGGRVVNLSSVAAVHGRGGIYSAAKAAVVGLTHSFAMRLAPDGITVNAVAPGFIPETEFFSGRLTPEFQASRVAMTPLARPGTAAEVAAAIFYLASPEASFVTGELHHVNGGSMLGR